MSHLSIPAHETKNNHAISLSVPRETSALLEEWITTFRPISASSDCIYLFPGCGTGNRPITPQGLRDAVKGVMRQHVGVELSPHQFRHLAAHHYLEAYPGHYASVQQLLGHKSPGTTRRHYVQKEEEAVHRSHDEVVLNRKKTLRPTGNFKASKRPTPRKPGTTR